MDRSDRAKQFMPFAAVTGLEKALREKEKELESDCGIINRNIRYEPVEEDGTDRRNKKTGEGE